MDLRSDPLRSEIVSGVLFGSGLSVTLWCLVLWRPAGTAPALLTLGFTVAVATVSLALPWAGRVPLALPATLFAVPALGPGAAVLVGGLARGLAPDAPPSEGAPGRAGMGQRFGQGVLAAGAGVAAWSVFGGEAGVGGPIPALGFAVLFSITEKLLDTLLALARRSRAARSALCARDVVRAAAALGGAALAGWLTARAAAEPALSAWLGAIPLVVFALPLARGGFLRPAHGARANRAFQPVTRALGKAIAAREGESEDHLHRIREICVAVGSRFEMADGEMESLSTAAFLHDVGKIAVPEPILSKPGRLTADEMDRVKVHPAAGAEILGLMGFSCAVQRIVRHHHERWDGRGYPDGLAGGEIPLGARILAAADCYDAIVSNRPYRRALSPREARRHLRHEAGAMFDPEVVDTLLDHLDEEGRLGSLQSPVASRAAGPQPRTRTALPREQQDLDHLEAIARAVRYPLPLDECLMLCAARVERLVPARLAVVWRFVADDRRLRAIFASGPGHERLLGLEIPADERPAAWVARHREALIVHDHLAPLARGAVHADLEPLHDDARFRALSSSVVAPLVHAGETLGAIALYDDDERPFTDGERRLLASVAGYVAAALARAHDPETQGDALTDRLTGLPNARLLRRAAAERTDASGPDPGAWGLVALRLAGSDALSARYGVDVTDEALVRVARRLAGACVEGETLVRFGQDLFVAFCPAGPGRSALAERWRAFVDAAEAGPLDLPPDRFQPRLVGAQAACPADGDSLDALLDALDARLSDGSAEHRTLIPFRARAATAANTEALAEERS